MIPLKDNVPSRTKPVVNYVVIALCSLTFLNQLGEEADEPSMVERYGMIPARVLNPEEPVRVVDREYVRTPFGVQVRQYEREAAAAAVPAVLTLLTSIFLHGGWMHFLGNMWFLYIFGDNVEDCFGHLGFLVFYLLSGAAASIAHLATNSGSMVPTIGASGAIAGVMGAYFILYPRARVLTLVPVFFFLHMIVLPAPLFLGIWFLIQFFQGAFAITSMQAAGVAWWAHIGGFVVGAVAALGLGRTHLLRPRVGTVRPGTERFGGYRVERNRPWW